MATDRFALARDMRAEGMTVISAQAQASSHASSRFFRGWFKRVSLRDKIIFAGNLSAMIGAGLSLSRALQILARQTEQAYFRSVISDVLGQINSGKTISQAMESYPTVFPEVFVAMTAAGEESGNLPQSLSIIKEQLTKTYELERKVKGAMIYPLVIFGLIIVVAILMMIFMVPTLSATFKDLNVPLPFLTRLIIGVSDWISQHLILFLLGLVAVAVGLVSFLRSVPGGRMLDWLALHLPVLSVISREINSAKTMRTIGSLITAGVSMTRAIQITSRVVENSYYRPLFAPAIAQIEKGQSLSAIFRAEAKLFPILVGELTEVGEETGKLAEMLSRGAEFYEEEVNQATKNLSTIIEPVLMIVIGIAVGFFVVAMISPMYSLTNAI